MTQEVNLGNKQVAKNMFFSFLSFGINLFIAFFFTPYLIRTVGSDAYSFFPLTNNLIGYTSIISAAVGSMAGRFIIMEFYGGKIDKAKVYFNSVFVANTFLSVFFSLLAVLVCYKLEYVLNIPKELIFDVKILFALTAFSMVASLPIGIFNIGLFVKNRNDISSRVGVVQNMFRVSFMLFLFYFFKPTIIYIGVAAVFSMFLGILISIYYKIKFLPEIPIRPRKYFDIKAVWTLVSSGIWNSFNQLSVLLLNQVDLLVCNIFISPSATAELAIAKTCPQMIDTIMGMMAGAFSPKYNILYAQNKIPELIHEIKKAMKVMGAFIGIPLGVLLIFGESFFSLWVSTMDAHKLYLLSCWTIVPMIIGASIYPIFGTYVITNKLKVPAFVLFGAGVLNLSVTYIILKTTDLGVWAIPIVSAVQYSLRHITFSVIYGAKSIGQKWNAFYPILFRAACGEFIVLIVGYLAKCIYVPHTWFSLIIEVGVVSLVSLVLVSYYMFDKAEKNYLLGILKSRLFK